MGGLSAEKNVCQFAGFGTCPTPGIFQSGISFLDEVVLVVSSHLLRVPYDWLLELLEPGMVRVWGSLVTMPGL